MIRDNCQKAHNCVGEIKALDYIRAFSFAFKDDILPIVNNYMCNLLFTLKRIKLRLVAVEFTLSLFFLNGSSHIGMGLFLC